MFFTHISDGSLFLLLLCKEEFNTSCNGDWLTETEESHNDFIGKYSLCIVMDFYIMHFNHTNPHTPLSLSSSSCYFHSLPQPWFYFHVYVHI